MVCCCLLMPYKSLYCYICLLLSYSGVKPHVRFLVSFVWFLVQFLLFVRQVSRFLAAFKTTKTVYGTLGRWVVS